MQRRDFITGIAGSMAAWPLAARAQQPAMPVIGFLNTGSPDLLPHHLAVFRQALSETGFVEGRNAVVEYRWARGRYDRLPTLATELVHGNVGIIVANGPAVPAAKLATNTIPIVFVTGVDPVGTGPRCLPQSPRRQPHRRHDPGRAAGAEALGNAASGHAKHSAGGGAGSIRPIRRDGSKQRTCARRPAASDLWSTS